MPLTFLARPGKWDRFQKAVGFAAADGEKSVTCAVSQEALEDLAHKVDMNPADCVATFEQHRAAIEQKAAALYASGRVRAGETVLIKASRIP
ncbi:MAG TPA: DUF1488 domain-containing protein [Alphaproteobacteria bacterium]|nr:DUF1488 domain-containing protein [Alphaproteobacteria bacterium]